MAGLTWQVVVLAFPNKWQCGTLTPGASVVMLAASERNQSLLKN